MRQVKHASNGWIDGGWPVKGKSWERRTVGGKSNQTGRGGEGGRVGAEPVASFDAEHGADAFGMTPEVA